MPLSISRKACISRRSCFSCGRSGSFRLFFFSCRGASCLGAARRAGFGGSFGDPASCCTAACGAGPGSAGGWGRSAPGSAVRRFSARSSSASGLASAPSRISPVGSSSPGAACGSSLPVRPNSRPSTPLCASFSLCSASRRTISAGISTTEVVKKSRKRAS